MIFHLSLEDGLPWDLKGGQDVVKMQKESITTKNLCKDGVPEELAEALFYVRSLEFNEKPDYTFISNKFKLAAAKLGINLKKTIFDW